MGRYRRATLIDRLNGRKAEEQVFTVVQAREGLDAVFREGIVRVQEEDQVPLCEGQCPVPGAVRAEVDGVFHKRARCEPFAKRFLLDESSRDFMAPIGRMIVDDNEFDIRKGLPVNALEAFLNVRFMLIASDDDAG
jgi:hypothetical protein